MTDLFPKTFAAALDYWTDVWQRTILTWDLLRERSYLGAHLALRHAR